MIKPFHLLAVLALPVAASAQPTSVAVKVADLNLTDAAGRTTLDRRISMAVRSICGRPTIDLVALRAHRSCVAEAMASAIPQKTAAIARAERGVQVAQAR